MPILNIEPRNKDMMVDDTRATIANAVAASEAILSNLIGSDLGSVDTIDLPQHLSALIGMEINRRLTNVAVEGRK